MGSSYRVSEPRRAFVLSLQALDWIRTHDPELGKVLEEADVTEDLRITLQAVDTIRLVPEAQVAVHRVRAALGLIG